EMRRARSASARRPAAAGSECMTSRVRPDRARQLKGRWDFPESSVRAPARAERRARVRDPGTALAQRDLLAVHLDGSGRLAVQHELECLARELRVAVALHLRVEHDLAAGAR